MGDLPEEFHEQFESKGESFFQIAELLYFNHGHQFTFDEIEQRVGITKSRVSTHINNMEDDWLNRHKGQTTVVWDTEAHNPATTETTDAVTGFYRDLWRLLQKHAETAPGIYALLGFLMFTASAVLLSFYIGYSLSITQNSGLPPRVYLVLGLGIFLTGVVVTLLAPLQAIVNRILKAYIPEELLLNRK